MKSLLVRTFTRSRSGLEPIAADRGQGAVSLPSAKFGIARYNPERPRKPHTTSRLSSGDPRKYREGSRGLSSQLASPVRRLLAFIQMKSKNCLARASDQCCSGDRRTHWPDVSRPGFGRWSYRHGRRADPKWAVQTFQEGGKKAGTQII